MNQKFIDVMRESGILTRKEQMTLWNIAEACAKSEFLAVAGAGHVGTVAVSGVVGPVSMPVAVMLSQLAASGPLGSGVINVGMRDELKKLARR